MLSTNKGLEAKLSEFYEFRKSTLESFKHLEEKVEVKTNRQLRKAIVVKELSEKPK